MALIGNIETFTGVPEEFEFYIERLKHLFTVNKVEENMKVLMLITLGGISFFQVLKNLVAPKKPTNFTFQEVKGTLIEHFSPPVSEICERHVFNRCEQKAVQSISDYSVELRKLANSSNFRQFLEEALRDRFVCGIRDKGTQKKLLVDLTFQNACQLALETFNYYKHRTTKYFTDYKPWVKTRLSNQMTSVKIKETSPDSERGLQFGSPVKTTDHSIPLETINPTSIELRRSNRVRHQPQKLDL
ncbi:uncharacterized protein [Diabrotica undecimpunctata]|uniref:uncharacterized protein n=1 Tax=Diabrotica undecimpunctata TaxID=50387 RepID=UPI003B642A6C